MDSGPWRVVEHVNDCCFRDIYKGGLWEKDLGVYALAHAGFQFYRIRIEISLVWNI